MRSAHLTLGLALLLAANLAAPAAAESTRRRLRNLQPKPMPNKAALNPKATAAKILERDPRFATLVESQNKEWKRALSRAVKNWGKEIRKRPVRITRPKPKMPTIQRPKVPQINWTWPTWSWPSIRVPSWRLPRLPWVSWGAVFPSLPSAPALPSWPSWLGWPSWLAIPRLPWIGWPSFPTPTLSSFDWVLTWLHGVAMILLAGFATYTGALLLLLALTRLGKIRGAGWWLIGLASLLPGRLRALIERLAGLVTAARESAQAREKTAPAAAAAAGAAAPIETEARVELAKRTPKRWKSYAHELMARGQGREAFRALYLAMMSRLDHEGLIHFDPALSNWDYRMMLPPGELRSAFSQLCRLFDQTHYGEYPCTQAMFDRGDGLVDQILAFTGSAQDAHVSTDMFEEDDEA